MRKNNYKIQKATDPTTIDTIGFQSRLEGLEVRDCLLILEPDNGCKLELLTRPPMNSTTLESVLKGEGGVFGIDSARISGNPQDANGRIYGKYDKGIAMKPRSSGRFPANLILEHGPSCYMEGTKKIKNTSGSVSGNEPSGVTKDIYGKYQGRKSFTAFGDEDGNEEVASWICEPTCPVATMDEQSGVLVSKWGKQGNSNGVGSMFFGDHNHNASESDNFIGDEGGASRYFKQVQSGKELNEYLTTLIRKEQ